MGKILPARRVSQNWVGPGRGLSLSKEILYLGASDFS